MKTYFVFSDVHGEYFSLKASLAKEGFDPDNKDHILFSLGDMFDRGPASDRVLAFLMDMDRRGRYISVLGNHDEMLIQYLSGLDSRNNLANNGLIETIQQLANNPGLTPELAHQLQDSIIGDIKLNYQNILSFLYKAPIMQQFGNYMFLHAGYSTRNFKTWELSTWGFTPYFVNHYLPLADEVYVFGHWHAFRLNRIEVPTPKSAAKPYVSKNFIGIDAASNYSKDIIVLKLYEKDDDWFLEIPEHRLYTEVV
jgi:serine/threonine protein phosphatase 1